MAPIWVSILKALLPTAVDYIKQEAEEALAEQKQANVKKGKVKEYGSAGKTDASGKVNPG